MYLYTFFLPIHIWNRLKLNFREVLSEFAPSPPAFPDDDSLTQVSGLHFRDQFQKKFHVTKSLGELAPCSLWPLPNEKIHKFSNWTNFFLNSRRCSENFDTDGLSDFHDRAHLLEGSMSHFSCTPLAATNFILAISPNPHSREQTCYVQKSKFFRRKENVLKMTLDLTQQRFLTDKLGRQEVIIDKTNFTYGCRECWSAQSPIFKKKKKKMPAGLFHLVELLTWKKTKLEHIISRQNCFLIIPRNVLLNNRQKCSSVRSSRVPSCGSTSPKSVSHGFSKTKHLNAMIAQWYNVRLKIAKKILHKAYFLQL